MLLSVAVYSMAYGWRYAAGLVGLIFVHECGHYLVARREGLNVGAPVFIPFVGAWISLKDTRMSAETEADVALAGPILGTAAAFACFLVGAGTGERLWTALAYAGFLLNLFNLIPLRPLDGGRVARIVSSKLWVVGLALLAGLFVWSPSPLLILVVLAAMPEAMRSFRGQGDQASPGLAPAVRMRYGALYLLLAGGLAVACFEVHGVLERAL
ncbi:MAG TPA: site-2 protease family protein [Albitalea sp.]|nr:site-2 protease family protein [Albitalea sp.]